MKSQLVKRKWAIKIIDSNTFGFSEMKKVVLVLDNELKFSAILKDRHPLNFKLH